MYTLDRNISCNNGSVNPPDQETAMQTELFTPNAQDFAVMAAGYLRLANNLMAGLANATVADRDIAEALVEHYDNRYHMAHRASLELRRMQP
jgi:hypothetical protein